MSAPTFTDRSFEQIARRALSRSSWGPLSPYREMLISRARLADARAFLGAHSRQGGKADRRYAIHVRARTIAALVAVVERLSDNPSIVPNRADVRKEMEHVA